MSHAFSIIVATLLRRHVCVPVCCQAKYEGIDWNSFSTKVSEAEVSADQSEKEAIVRHTNTCLPYLHHTCSWSIHTCVM